MRATNIIVIGASSGGVKALQTVVGRLSSDVGAAVFVVMHTAPDGPGLLPEILNSAGPLVASHAVDGERFKMGRVYVAPPDNHMLVEAPDTIRVSRGPKENRSRPAIDPLFRSAALAFGPRVTGVILTGNLDDGTAGLVAVKQRGGMAVVQDPAEAFAPSMPQSALRHVDVDHCLALEKIAPILMKLAALETPASQAKEIIPMADELKFEVDIAALHKERNPSEILKLGDPSLFTCPDCHGTLVQLREKAPLRFRCHTGHAYTASSLVAALNESTENTLWSTLRVLEEKIMLLQHMATHSRDSGDASGAQELQSQALIIQKRVHLVRQALLAADTSLVEQAAE